jgi:hypothetical protein
MSLDGYVVGPQDSVNEPMGVGEFRLFNRRRAASATSPTRSFCGCLG